jgi:hypothetical protein
LDDNVATNFYFNNFTNSGEQNLIEDLIIETIRIYGLDVWYLPRTLGGLDDLLNEDDLSIFDKAYMVEMYIKSVDGFEGDGQFLSKFGLQIRDSVTFTMSQRKFVQDVGLYNEEVRPNEGDLIYFPLNRKLFEVMFVDNKPVFYQMGALQMYDLRCELFEFSNERFATGVLEIDVLLDAYRTTGTNANTAVANVESLSLLGADNFTIETTADSILDFSETNPFGDNNY